MATADLEQGIPLRILTRATSVKQPTDTEAHQSLSGAPDNKVKVFKAKDVVKNKVQESARQHFLQKEERKGL